MKEPESLVKPLKKDATEEEKSEHKKKVDEKKAKVLFIYSIPT